MTLEQIKQAVKEGKTVCWTNQGYIVKHNTNALGEESWIISFTPNGHAIGLTWMDGVTMNGKEEDFFIKERN